MEAWASGHRPINTNKTENDLRTRKRLRMARGLGDRRIPTRSNDIGIRADSVGTTEFSMHRCARRTRSVLHQRATKSHRGA